jgi:hypothetical protein
MVRWPKKPQLLQTITATNKLPATISLFMPFLMKFRKYRMRL